MKVAMYKCLDYGGESISSVTDYMEESITYVRITDIHEIELVKLDKAAIILSTIEKLRIQKTKAIVKFDDKIAKLLALTHDPVNSDLEDNIPF